MAKDDIARGILGIDPDAGPECARKAVKSHMARARWMGEVGYLLFAAGDYPGNERDEAELLEFLQSIGITLAPRGGMLDEKSWSSKKASQGTSRPRSSPSTSRMPSASATS